MNIFKRGDVVLVRDHKDKNWEVAIYYGYDETADEHMVSNSATDSELIPYFTYVYCKPYNKEVYVSD